MKLILYLLISYFHLLKFWKYKYDLLQMADGEWSEIHVELFSSAQSALLSTYSSGRMATSPHPMFQLLQKNVGLSVWSKGPNTWEPVI